MKSKPVIESLISNGFIPKNGPFEITNELIDEYYKTYSLTHSKTNDIARKPSVIRYSRRMAGIALFDEINSRMETVEKPVKEKFQTKSGFLYIVENPVFPNYVKIGITRNMNSRLSTYQTSDPHRSFKVKHIAFFENVRSVEKEIISRFNVNVSTGEWVEKNYVDRIIKYYFSTVSSEV